MPFAPAPVPAAAAAPSPVAAAPVAAPVEAAPATADTYSSARGTFLQLKRRMEAGELSLDEYEEKRAFLLRELAFHGRVPTL